jgi:hypothetical protein
MDFQLPRLITGGWKTCILHQHLYLWFYDNYEEALSLEQIVGWQCLYIGTCYIFLKLPISRSRYIYMVWSMLMLRAVASRSSGQCKFLKQMLIDLAQQYARGDVSSSWAVPNNHDQPDQCDMFLMASSLHLSRSLRKPWHGLHADNIFIQYNNII